MAKLNILTSIQIYKDSSPTNNPLQSTANWTTNQVGVEVSEPATKSLIVASQQRETLFSGVVETSVDNTTTFDLTKKSGVSNTYILKHNSGTAPEFRTERALGIDDTTQFSVSKAGSLITLTHTGGQAPDFSSAIFGDTIVLGNSFDMFNRGRFKVLNITNDAVTFENIVGVAENITINDSNDLRIFSADGVQVGQKVKISAGFSVYSQDVYEITDVFPDYIEFNSSKQLPQESGILSETVVYKNSKSFLYIEYDKQCTLIINGVERKGLKPLTIGTKKANGIVLEVSDMYSAQIKNESLDSMNVTMITAE
jgi:hypothetical protein